MASEGGGGAGSPAYAEFPRSFPPGSPAFSARSGPSEGGGGGGASASLRGAPASGTSVGELVDKALNRTAAVQVVLRIRPMSSVELRHADPEPALRAAHEHGAEFRVVEAVVNRGAKDEVVTRFSFDRVSPPEVGQRELFVMSGVQELMDAALTGINVSVFAYGQTGSGKTYTMSGHEERLAARFAADDTSMGIIPRAVAYLFRRVQEDAWGSRTVMKAAFSEVYNEVRAALPPPPPLFFQLRKINLLPPPPHPSSRARAENLRPAEPHRRGAAAGLLCGEQDGVCAGAGAR
jgi:hypothetical protein